MIVKELSRHFKAKKNLHRVFAVAMLLLLLFEWGSHNVAFAHHSSTEGQTSHSDLGGHEDPCKTMIHCPDGNRRELPPPNLGHDPAQQNGLLDLFKASAFALDPFGDSRIPRSGVRPLFRPPTPPYRPPEIS